MATTDVWTRDEVDLAITGMTCTSCAARVEKKLNKLPGVSATVNYATETAHVVMGPDTVLGDLLRTVEQTGYSASLADDAEELDAEVDSLRRRFWVALILALPVAALAMIPALQVPTWQWVSLALTTPIVVWAAWPFHRAAGLNARHGVATMDSLVSVGIVAAYGWSLWALLFGGAGALDYTMSHGLFATNHGGPPDLYFEVAAAVPVFLLAGRWFEARAKKRSSAALRALVDLAVPEATLLRDGQEIRVATSEIEVGDRFIVRPGERIATDGVVVAGSSAIDAAMLTGESVPVEVGIGDEVTGATINVDGVLTIEATRIGGNTRLAHITRLVTQAQAGKAPIQRLADRISAVFVPIVFVIAAVTLAMWLFVTGNVEGAFTAAVAVLIIACPCALGLATPTALLVGSGRGAQMGILIRGPETLEDTRRVDTIVLDKTGTVTSGRMSVVDVVGGDDVVRRAAAVEAGSEHPVARAIVTHVKDATGASLVAPAEFVNERGRGARAVIEGDAVAVGRPEWVAQVVEAASGASAELMAWIDEGRARGWTVVAVGWSGAVRGAIAVADSPRDSSAAAIAGFRSLGLEPILLTGDNALAAQAVATDVGIDEVIAEVMPEDKVAVVGDLQQRGRVVAMVGDGVNDAAALAQADLGIAMGGGAAAATEASDLTLVREDLLAAVDAIRLSRRTLRTIQGNLFWAFAYNVAMIPLAAVGLLNPLLAGAAMAFSSVFVVANSLRLRRFRSISSSHP